MIVLHDPKISFISPRTKFYQWDDETLKEKLEKGFQVTGGKAGAYFAKNPPGVELTATAEGESIKTEITSLVCDYYKVEEFDEDVFKKFELEIQNELILLIYDDRTKRVEILKR